MSQLIDHHSSFSIYITLRSMAPHAGFTISKKPGTYDLVFDPPKGSDELSDALRAAYPHEKTLKQRRRQAIIEFYLREKEEDDQRSNSISSAKTQAMTSPSSSNSCQSQQPFAFNSDSLSSQDDTGRGQLTLELETLPTKRKKTAHTTYGQETEASGFRTFRLTNKNKAQTKSKKPKTQQELDAYRIRKQSGACDYHRNRKRKVTTARILRRNCAEFYSVLSIALPGNLSLTHLSTCLVISI